MTIVGGWVVFIQLANYSPKKSTSIPNLFHGGKRETDSFNEERANKLGFITSHFLAHLSSRTLRGSSFWGVMTMLDWQVHNRYHLIPTNLPQLNHYEQTPKQKDANFRPNRTRQMHSCVNKYRVQSQDCYVLSSSLQMFLIHGFRFLALFT